MGKKAQNAVVVAMLLIVMILVLFLIFLVLFYGNSGIVLTSYTVNEPKDNVKYQKEKKITITLEEKCSPPYLQYGNVCCLDSNYNNVCDSIEAEEKRLSETIRYDNCDRECRRIEEDGYLNRPFLLSDVDFSSDEITLRIRNRGSDDYTIRSISISGCGTEDFDHLISEDKTKSFTIDCDDANDRRSRNVEIEFENGEEDVARGRIRRYYTYYNCCRE